MHCLPLTFGRLKNCWELIMHGLDITNVPKHLIPGKITEVYKNVLEYTMKNY